jgi:WD40 repeat protein
MTIRIWDSNNGFLIFTLQQHNEWVRRVTQTIDGKLLASASKDETVIIWSLERIMQNLNNSKGVDQKDFIITIIDEHEHVIDCIRFAPETACKTIMMADYNKMGGFNFID